MDCSINLTRRAVVFSYEHHTTFGRLDFGSWLLAFGFLEYPSCWSQCRFHDGCVHTLRLGVVDLVSMYLSFSVLVDYPRIL